MKARTAASARRKRGRASGESPRETAAYGAHRVRLVATDPEALYAHWDLDSVALDRLARQVGRRVLAVSPLTLRVSEPGHGRDTETVFVPADVRSWHFRPERRRRAYRAEIGVTLPSGRFRRLAVSRTVVPPRGAPSTVPAQRTMTMADAAALDLSQARRASRASVRGLAALDPDPQPASGPEGSAPSVGASDALPLGGASDRYRR